MKKQVFKTAWAFFKDQTFTTFSECLKMAWRRVKISARLKAGVVYFQFQKVDGTIRNCIGTLHPDNFHYTSKSGQTKVNPGTTVKYWDVEKRAFRSFRLINFISFT